MDDRILFVDEIEESVSRLITLLCAERFAVLTDTHMSPLIDKLLGCESVLATAPRIIIPEGESNKNIKTLTSVWEGFESSGLTRKSAVINVGGGMVTDLGGFAASTFKRGIPFINIPTTLLGAADASVGGKMAVNFGGLKNEVGVFALPYATLISTAFFDTLTDSEFFSGYGEIVKMGFISGWEKAIQLMTPDGREEIMQILPEALRFAVCEKARIVEEDPTEKELRKVLNFGHTAGHAFESLLNTKGYPIPHGEAVAHGILFALILSHTELGAESEKIQIYANWLHRSFRRLPIGCNDYDELISLMLNDKKNANRETVNFVLIKPGGEPELSYPATPEKIKSTLDIFRDF